MDKKKETMEMLSLSIQPDSFTINSTFGTIWNYWEEYYYPYMIKESYPVWVQERAVDKGKKVYEIVKMLRDKKLVQVRTVKQFIEIMDELIKVI